MTGPGGDFWLRVADAPLVLVAGGSGLAPVLSVLEDAARAGVKRDAVFLFGARTQQDLYQVEAIEAIAGRWAAGFRFRRCSRMSRRTVTGPARGAWSPNAWPRHTCRTWQPATPTCAGRRR